MFSNKNISLYKFLKFAVVGGIGAIITWGLTFLLTEKAGLWYMWSLVFSTFLAMTSNYILNSLWTFKVEANANDADYEWNSYYKGNMIQRWWKKSLAKTVISMIPRNKEQLSYIDYGCGSSPLAILIGSHKYLGVDSNPDKIAFMNRTKLGCRFICDGIVNSKYSEASGLYKGYDIAMAVEVVEHMPDMNTAEKLVKNLSQSINKNGSVIIATPDFSSIRWRAIEKMYGWLMPSAYANDHKVRFSEKTLIDLCKTNGLKHTETRRVAGCDMVCKFEKN